MDANVATDDRMSKISQETDDIGNMITMDGRSRSTPARSCRDVIMDNHTAEDGM